MPIPAAWAITAGTNRFHHENDGRARCRDRKAPYASPWLHWWDDHHINGEKMSGSQQFLHHPKCWERNITPVSALPADHSHTLQSDQLLRRTHRQRAKAALGFNAALCGPIWRREVSMSSAAAYDGRPLITASSRWPRYLEAAGWPATTGWKPSRRRPRARSMRG